LIARFGGSLRIRYRWSAEAFSFLIGLYETGRMRFDELDQWLRQHAIPASSPD
jgi:hypothetical protein